MDFQVIIHGGAGIISKSIDGAAYFAALERIIRKIHSFITSTASDVTAVDVVEFAVKQLEDEPLFNAGRGSVLTNKGTFELEASIMDGRDLGFGASSLVSTVKNPVSLARLVMEKTRHCYLVGESAAQLAEAHGLEAVADPLYYATEKRLHQLRGDQAAGRVALDHSVLGGGDSKGTVGCVAMVRGHVAAATSTGGLSNKMSGRIGDTPICGGGTYASDDSCAVSATGTGEILMKYACCHAVSARVQLLRCSLQEAVDGVLAMMPPDTGGIIACNSRGDFSMGSNCGGMFRAQVSSDGSCRVGIWEEEIITRIS